MRCLCPQSDVCFFLCLICGVSLGRCHHLRQMLSLHKCTTRAANDNRAKNACGLFNMCTARNDALPNAERVRSCTRVRACVCLCVWCSAVCDLKSSYCRPYFCGLGGHSLAQQTSAVTMAMPARRELQHLWCGQQGQWIALKTSRLATLPRLNLRLCHQLPLIKNWKPRPHELPKE